MDRDRQQLAEAVRDACVDTLLDAYQDAALQGLCESGRWEHALGILRRTDPEQLLPSPPRGRGPEPPAG